MKRFICSLAALAAVLASLAVAAAAAADTGEVAAKFKIGDKAPDFTLQELGGQEIQLSAVSKSKVVLLAFWSLRCGACVQEIPYLEQLHKGFSQRGVSVLSVVIDGADAATTRAIMKETGNSPSYPVLMDPDFAVSDVYTNFVVPHTLVIDRTGIVRYVHTGFEPGTEKQYETALLEALGR